MKTSFILRSLVVLTVLWTTGCTTTFKGKFIDADTKEPIEGVVVVATWSEETTFVGATHSKLKEVKEVLSNEKGEWKIKGPRGMGSEFMETITSIITLSTGAYYTRPPDFIFFKPGYCSYPHEQGVLLCKQKIKYVRDTLELPKLASREDRLRNSRISLPHDDSNKIDQKIINLKKLLNEEYKYLGVPEYSLEEDSANEK